MKLRRNHIGTSNGLSVAKLIVYSLLALILMAIAYFGAKNVNIPTKSDGYEVVTPDQYEEVVYSYLPSHSGELVHHQYYSLSYMEKHEQAEWVAYELTQEQLRVPNVARYDRFERDPDVSTKSAGYYDYRGSGYTRGHLAPAGDMAFDALAMKESFFMSNISPQTRQFNNGIWKELEEQTRDWVYHNDKMYIVTGPVLSDSYLQKIEKEKVTIPRRFFKALLCTVTGKEKAIAFLIPHERSEQPLQDFAITIDELENQTGIDFFYHLDDDPRIEELESKIDLGDWKFSEARYKLRIEKWNNE